MSKKSARSRRRADDGHELSTRRDPERELEEGLQGTFPASDPIAITDPVVVVGISD
ncbi:MAG TPA: hypothetical protein VFB29_09125 [Pseudolabrys sp.]|nr:hypothetical protein [Pseudolabrys sp.]